jgi:acyl-CoA reductase-like NAD-dependent aldehyde dehydrogenase
MDNLELLAVAETWDNGKPIREILAADHFRYVAGAIRAQEGSLSQIDDDTTAHHYHEPRRCLVPQTATSPTAPAETSRPFACG